MKRKHKQTRFYAVYHGEEPGVYETWADCQKQVAGFKGAIYKSFADRQSAQYFSQWGEIPTNFDPLGEHAETLVIYTDGSFMKSTGHAGMGIVFPQFPRLNKSLPFETPPLTNQRAEVQAITEAIKTATEADLMVAYECILIYTDSMYAINCFDTFIPTWNLNGWVTRDETEVKNQDVLRPFYRTLKECPIPVELKHVLGHNAERYNEDADRLARLAAQ